MPKHLYTNNPLLDFFGLPRFADICPEHVTPAVDFLLAENRKTVARLLADETANSWESFVQPFENANEQLTRAWGQVSHLNAVMNTAALREVYNANLPKVTQYYAELSQNMALFQKYQMIHDSSEFQMLSTARQKIIENELRDFRLGGAALPDNEKARFMAIQEELSSVCAKFSDNILDATNDYGWLVEDEDKLAGIPADERQVAREAALASNKNGWLFTLKAPSYGPLMQYADHRALRERMYIAYSTRASELGNAAWDNSQLMIKIVKLRAEKAQLLGYANYAELSLATKMANSVQQIQDFLFDLSKRARGNAERDLKQLQEFANSHLGIRELRAWDVSYASEHLRQHRYAFSEQEVKQYFPEDKVVAGMFGLVKSLYGLSVHASTAPTWHAAVRFFDIRDGDGMLVGQFYLDLYARDSKRGGAWMDDAITRRRTADGMQTPVAYLNCNFAAPVGGRSALFTHDEVITLFHEFGHGLHHLLTQVEELGVSGINGVQWDAVELPSQFMENFCWEWSVLQDMTRHADSGEKLPRALFEKMLAAKNFQSGLHTLRQIEFALFDIRLHGDFDVLGAQTILQLLDDVRKEVAVLMPPAFNRFPNSFSHIFAGGYAAGYYSYKWAEVLSADAYSLFEESGVLNQAVGLRFRNEILAVGGSRDAMQSFVAFRGREPSIDALLRHCGLLENSL